MSEINFQFFVGIDLGSQQHSVRLLDGEGHPVGQREVEHGGVALNELLLWLGQASSAAAPAQVAVAVEAPRGAVIDALLECGYAVYSINPKQLDRFRDRFSMAGAKDDRRDALVLASSLRTDPAVFRRLHPEEPRIIRIRELSRTEDALEHTLRGECNRLWSYLQRYFPALLALCPGAEEPWLWDLLRRCQAVPARAARLRSSSLQQLLSRHRIRRFSAQQLQQALQHPLALAPGVHQALAEQVLFLLPRLEMLYSQRRALMRRIEELIEELAGDESFCGRRSVAILRSIPGVGRVTTAAVLAEAFQPLQQADYQSLRALAGVAPVTQQSGKTRLVSMRKACNRRLQQAVFHAASVYVQHDPRAHQLYAHMRRKHNHARAVRGAADRLLDLLCLLVHNDALYDPARRTIQPQAA